MIEERESYKLLVPGWPGALNAQEMVYLKRSLESSKRLRKKWGFGDWTDTPSDREIAKVAAQGPEALNPPMTRHENGTKDVGEQILQGRLF